MIVKPEVEPFIFFRVLSRLLRIYMYYVFNYKDPFLQILQANRLFFSITELLILVLSLLHNFTSLTAKLTGLLF